MTIMVEMKLSFFPSSTFLFMRFSLSCIPKPVLTIQLIKKISCRKHGGTKVFFNGPAVPVADPNCQSYVLLYPNQEQIFIMCRCWVLVYINFFLQQMVYLVRMFLRACIAVNCSVDKAFFSDVYLMKTFLFLKNILTQLSEISI